MLGLQDSSSAEVLFNFKLLHIAALSIVSIAWRRSYIDDSGGGNAGMLFSHLSPRSLWSTTVLGYGHGSPRLAKGGDQCVPEPTVLLLDMYVHVLLDCFSRDSSLWQSNLMYVVV